MGFLRPGKNTSGMYEIAPGRSIPVTIDLTREGNYLMTLTISKSIRGMITTNNHQVTIHARPANVGEGVLYYFLCPVTGKPCRVLYLIALDSIFQSREAILHQGHRLYYPKQTYSKKQREPSKW